MEKQKWLSYELMMMGVPLDGPSNVYVDNECVANSSERQETSLKKKYIFIAFHYVRECFAAGIITTYNVQSEDYLSDEFATVLNREQRSYIFGTIFW